MNVSNVKITDNSKLFINAKDEAVLRALEAIGIDAEAAAKLELENAPRRVDTGLLRNSITHATSGNAPAIHSYHASYGENRVQKGKNKGKRRSASAKNAGSVKVGYYKGNVPNDPENNKAVYIGTNIEYAPYVHEGTQHMRPNRFLKNAVEKNVSRYKQIAEKELKKG